MPKNRNRLVTTLRIRAQLLSYCGMVALSSCGLYACGEPGGAESNSGAGGTDSTSAGSAGVAGSASGGSGGGAGGSSGNGGAGSGAVAGTGGVAGAGASAGMGGHAAGTAGNGGAGAAGSSGQAGFGQGGFAGSAGSSAGVGGAGNAGAGQGGGGMSGAGAGGTSEGGAGGAAGSAGAGYEPCPETGSCKIMPFGDSITEGFDVQGGYRLPLFSLAREDGRDITFVGSSTSYSPNTMVDGVPFPRNHEGHGGYTIEDVPARNANGIARFVEPSIDDYAPHIITLMIGTNDLNGNIDVAGAPARLGALLDRIHDAAPDVLVILAQIVPTRTDGTNQVVQNYNAAMPALVAERADAGRHLVLIDMYEAFTSDQNYKNALLADNLHPNQAGYERMAETWYAALQGYLR